MKEKLNRGKWKFGIEYCGGDWCWSRRIDDGYLNGYFIGVWFIGWMR